MSDSLPSTSLATMRIDYAQHQLLEAEIAPGPSPEFHAWFEEARRHGVLEPNAMIFSTADPSGGVSSRVLLLKGLDDRRFQFSPIAKAAKAANRRRNRRLPVTFFSGGPGTSGGHRGRY